MTAERMPGAEASPRAPLTSVSGFAPSAERFTQARVERILSLVIALGCAVIGTQSFLNALGSTHESAGWHVGLMVAAFAPLGLMVLSLAAGVFTRAASRICAVALVGVFACWPFATAGTPAVAGVQPWIWYLLNVTTAAAVAAFRLPLQLVWVIGVPVLYAAVRLLPLAGAGDAVVAPGPTVVVDIVLDAVFAMILGGVIVTLGWMLRSVAAGIDRARAEAVASYAAAAAADAAEAERVAVAALMHDSVLAALIAAERAATPRERTLAVAMAREALTRLANAEQDAGEGPEEPVTVASVVAGIERAAVDLAAAHLAPAPTITADVAPGAPPVPGRVARAIVLAATQAVANSLQHAGGRGLAVEVRADDGTVAVRISDAGDGFVPRDVPADRLGIRGSIVARMAAAGGRARVRTGAEGTTVLLDWERPR